MIRWISLSFSGITGHGLHDAPHRIEALAAPRAGAALACDLCNALRTGPRSGAYLSVGNSFAKADDHGAISTDWRVLIMKTIINCY
jgi:hypothetical protein